MNLNGEFELDNEDGQDVVTVSEPDLPVNEENQVVDPQNPEVEIDTAEETVEETLREEMPDVEADLVGIAALEEAFQQLQYVSQDIASCGGMSRAIAVEADRCIPGFLNDKRPAAFYTEAPSATNLRYAIEEISAKKAGIFAAIFAAIAAAMYKLYQWFKNHKGEKDDWQQIKSDIDKIHAKYTKATRSEAGSIDNLMHDVAENEGIATKKLLDEIDGVTLDVLSPNSVLIKKISSLIRENNGARGIAAISHAMSDTLDSLYDTAERQISSFKITDQTKAEFEIKKIQSGTHPALSPVLTNIRYNGREQLIVDVRDSIRESYDKLKSSKTKVSRFSEIISGIHNLGDEHLTKEIAEIDEALIEALSKFTEKLAVYEKMVKTATVETSSGSKSSPNFKGQQELADAAKHVQRAFTNLVDVFHIGYEVLVVHPKACLSLLERSHSEAKAYLKKLKAEYVVDGRAESHSHEIERIETFLKAFSDKEE